MNEEKRNAVDAALEHAGLNRGRVAIGTYDTDDEGTVGVYFHYRLTEELANALIKLAMQDETVYEGLLDLRQGFDLILEAIDKTKHLQEERDLH